MKQSSPTKSATFNQQIKWTHRLMAQSSAYYIDDLKFIYNIYIHKKGRGTGKKGRGRRMYFIITISCIWSETQQHEVHHFTLTCSCRDEIFPLNMFSSMRLWVEYGRSVQENQERVKNNASSMLSAKPPDESSSLHISCTDNHHHSL